jgi:hypothetical protein
MINKNEDERKKAMKKSLYLTTLIVPIFLIALVGCGKTTSEPTATTNPPAAATATVMATATAAATTTAAPTVEIVPTASAVPTLMPCMIVFDTNRDGNREVYTMGPDGKDPVNLSNNPGEDSDPAWSPSGSQIAFVSNRINDAGGGQFIYVMKADGSDVRQLTLENESKLPDWSHDGSQITYSYKGDIFIIKADGSGSSLNLTNSPEEDTQPSWSPDGSMLTWLSEKNGQKNIFVMSTDGNYIKQLTGNGKVDYVAWTTDGQIFAIWDQPEGICKKCVMGADGSKPQDAGGKGEQFRYFPFRTEDGHLVECVSANFTKPDNEIYLIGEIFPDIFLNLSNNPADDQNPDWPLSCLPTSVDAAKNTEQVQATALPTKQEIVIGYADTDNKMPGQKEAELLKACSELKVKCVKSDSITKLVEQNVSAILVYSNRFNVLGAFPQISDARSKGIQVIILDAETSVSGAYNLSIDSDSVRSSLEWMFKEMGGKGDFAYFNVDQNATHQALIEETLKKYPDISATALPARYDRESMSEKDIAALASSNPNLLGVWTDNTFGNIFWGLRNGQIENPPAILCEPKADSLQNWKDWTNGNKAVKCFSSVLPGGTAYEGVYVALYILSGEVIDPAMLGGKDGNTFIYDYPKITNDNLDEWLGKIDTLRKGEWDILEIPPMTPEQIKEKWFLD